MVYSFFEAAMAVECNPRENASYINVPDTDIADQNTFSALGCYWCDKNEEIYRAIYRAICSRCGKVRLTHEVLNMRCKSLLQNCSLRWKDLVPCSFQRIGYIVSDASMIRTDARNLFCMFYAQRFDSSQRLSLKLRCVAWCSTESSFFNDHIANHAMESQFLKINGEQNVLRELEAAEIYRYVKNGGCPTRSHYVCSRHTHSTTAASHSLKSKRRWEMRSTDPCPGRVSFLYDSKALILFRKAWYATWGKMQLQRIG